MAVGEAPRLRLARLLFVYGEPGEAKLSTRAVIIFNRLAVYAARAAVGTDIGVPDSQQVSVYEVIHETPEFGLCARTRCHAAMHLLGRLRWKTLVER